MSMFKRALAGLGEGMVEVANSNIQHQKQTARDKALFVQQERLQKMRLKQDQSQFETREANDQKYRQGTLAIQQGELERKRTNDKFDRFDNTLQMYVGAVQKLDEAWAEESSFLDPEDPQMAAKHSAYVERRAQLSDRIDNLAAANPDVAKHYGFTAPPELDTQDIEMSEAELKAEEDRALAIAADLGVPGVGDNAAAEPTAAAPDPLQDARDATGVTAQKTVGDEISGMFSRAADSYREAMASDKQAAQDNWWKEWGPSVIQDFEKSRTVHDNVAKRLATTYDPQQMRSMGLPDDLVTYVSTFKPGYKPQTTTPTPPQTAAAGVPQ